MAEKIRQIDFDAVALTDLIDFLVELTRVPITLDLEALQRAGVEPTDRVSVHEQDATVGQILTAAVARLGLTSQADERQVVVTAPGPSWKTVLYRIDDLLRVPSEGGPAPTLEQFAARLRQLLAPDTWQGAGGRGAIRLRDGALEIDQATAVHYEILAFCEKLRVARGLPLRSRLPAARFQLVSRRGRLRPLLDRHITFTFAQPAPFLQVIAYLRRATGLVITADWRRLAAKEIFPDSPIACAAIDRPLGAALSGILEPLGLAWRATDCGALQVTTAAAVAGRPELEFYPLSRKGELAPVAAQLPAELQQSVRRESWRKAGGAGRAVYDGAAATLIVLQTQPVQAQVERWLNQHSALRNVP